MVYSAGLITFFIWAIFNRHCRECGYIQWSIRKILSAKKCCQIVLKSLLRSHTQQENLLRWEMPIWYGCWIVHQVSWPVSHLLCTQNNILQVRSTMKHPGPVEKFVPPLWVSGAAYRSLCNYKFLSDPRDRWNSIHMSTRHICTTSRSFRKL